MDSILVATGGGCQVFSGNGSSKLELPGKIVWAIAPEPGGACVAIVNDREIWRRSAAAEWSHVATAEIALASIVSVNGKAFAGTMNGAEMIIAGPNNKLESLPGFQNCPGREKWVGNGPPLHVRSLAATASGDAILAAVHVGGIPRTTDGGKTWLPTINIMFDVHEVCSHATTPLVAAAAAVGLCVSHDGGKKWTTIKEGLELTNSLAVAVLENEVLFSIQDGPFAARSQIWRWPIGASRVELVRNGLPEYLKGKVDTGHLAAGRGRAAVVDGGGDLWLSKSGSTDWERVATDLNDAFSVQILPCPFC